MLMALHADALFELLITDPVDIFTSPFSHSKISVTSSILDEYEAKFSGSSNLHTYHAFMQAMSARLKSVSASGSFPACSISSDYFDAAIRGGRYLGIPSQIALCAVAQQSAEKHGLRCGAVPGVFAASANHGFSPFETHHLKSGEQKYPEEVLRFFREEARITVYDKYIGDASIDFINEAMSIAAPNCKLLVMMAGRGSLTVGEVKSSITLSREQEFEVCVVNRDTEARVHDRHIFLSSDVEIHLTRGTDCFGRAPGWRNEGGSLYLYDTSSGREISFGISADRGQSARRPIRVKSCVIR